MVPEGKTEERDLVESRRCRTGMVPRQAAAGAGKHVEKGRPDPPQKTPRHVEESMTHEPHRPTSRVLDILETLAQRDGGLTLTELSRSVDAPASSLTPFLRTLCARGYLDCNRKNMVYTLGARTLLLSAAFATTDIYSLTMQEMQRVVDRCSETCQLGIREGSNVFYIAKIDSPEPLRLVSSVGKSLPASCTAIGKALLCDCTRQEVESLYPDGLPALTPSSIRDMDEFCGQLARIHMGEFALDVDESHEHLRCFALPIRLDGQVDAAVSVSMPAFRLDEDKERLVRACLLTARNAVERHLSSAGHGFSGK